MKGPEISVIMPVYNSESYVSEAIKSILHQTYDDFEFIIINDGSDDGSLNEIQSFNDERIRIINNKSNIGVTMSLNIGLKHAKGEYIARQDSDDISLKNRLEKQVNYTKKHEDVVLLGTSYYTINEFGEKLGKVIRLKKPSFNDLYKENHFTSGSVLFKKEVVCNLGGYDALFKYRQDYNLWLRIAKFNKVRNLTEPLYISRFHYGSIGFRRTEEAELYRILAKKMINEDIDHEIIKDIKKDGIKSIYSILNEDETKNVTKVMGEESAYMDFLSGLDRLSTDKYPFLSTLYCLSKLKQYNILNEKTRDFFTKFHYFKYNFIMGIRNLN